jgi:kynurenine formamidase
MLMQSEWLRRYFTQQHSEQCSHAMDMNDTGAEPEDNGVSRRDFVKSGFVAGMAAGMAAGGIVGAFDEAEAEEAQNVMGKWWPSEWGPEDQVGASNRITPAKVLEAASLIQKGNIYRMGMVLEAGVPVFGARHVSITIPGGPTGGPFGEQELMYNDDMFSGEIGQVGSQFDGLGHISAKVGNTIRYYNGFTQEQVGGSYGLKMLGVENVKPFFTRGILLDVLSLKGGDRLPIGYVITMDDVIQTMRKQGLNEPKEGDAVFFRTGHIKLWMKDNAEYNKGCPGPGATVAKWLTERKIACVGGDTWPVEAVPGENPRRPFECHVIWIAMHGIHIIENQNLEDLAKDQVYEFAWSFNPLPIKGGTGSPGNSVAIA